MDGDLTGAERAQYRDHVPTDNPSPDSGKRRPRRAIRRLGMVGALAVAASAACLALPGNAHADGLPVLAVSCTSSTYGFVGQPVTLSPLAVIGTVKDAAEHADGLPDNAGSRIGWDFGPKLPFTIGTISKYSETSITGSDIADAVVDEVADYDEIAPAPKAFAAALHKRMDSDCGLTAHAWNGHGEPPATQSPSPPSGNGTSTHAPSDSKLPSPLGSTSGGGSTLPSAGSRLPAAPPRDYSHVPAALPGEFSPAPSSMYGQVPGHHAPKVEKLSGDGHGRGIDAAGHAQALGHPGQPTRDVGLPLLLAVLALAGVTGALLRTWVLRKSAHIP